MEDHLPMRSIPSIAAVGAAVVVLALGTAPFLASAADHLDAPNLGAIHVDGSDNLSVTKANGPLDINDVYVFKGASAGHTVLAMTVNPAVNLGIGPSTFRAGAEYAFNIDTNGNSRADRQYEITFGGVNSKGQQSYRVVYEKDDHTRTLVRGMTGTSTWSNDTGAFAGVRSDPFFFDLLGFLGSVKGEGTRRLDDGKQSDFFVGLNTLAIVIEVPNTQIGGTGRNIGVWGTTRDPSGRRIDQMGRPAINTVFNPAADKVAFNKTAPYLQPTANGGTFRTNVVSTLAAFSSLDSEGAYSSAQTGALADILLPDELRYDVGSVAAGPLNGRGLADDVIDAELNIVTGGFPFAGRDGTGAIPTDGVGPHGDYHASFPYLGNPH
jgi:hypothetical protein